MFSKTMTNFAKAEVLQKDDETRGFNFHEAVNVSPTMTDVNEEDCVSSTRQDYL